MRCRE
ncbi:hypothetical protein A2U01_0101574, partial [Trifolium medium]